MLILLKALGLLLSIQINAEFSSYSEELSYIPQILTVWWFLMMPGAGWVGAQSSVVFLYFATPQNM